MKVLLITLIVCIASTCCMAQDKIFKKDKSIIECKVVEIGLDEIKYNELDMESGPIISIAITEITKVELSNGRVIEFKDPLTDPQTYVENRKSALKIHFLSPLLEHLSFSYERSIKPGRSLETSLGLVGLGFNTEDHIKSAGVNLAIGYKFMRTPDFYARRFVYAHILKGAYIKPELLLSIYNMKKEDYSYNFNGNPTLTTQEQDIVTTAVVINFGKQVVYDNFFLIDWSFGVGYGYSTQKTYDNDFYYDTWRANQYGFILGDETFPIALTAKLKVGFLLK